MDRPQPRAARRMPASRLCLLPSHSLSATCRASEATQVRAGTNRILRVERSLDVVERGELTRIVVVPLRRGGGRARVGTRCVAVPVCCHM
eukprot:2549495-Prymnesium_polylepis.1